MSNHFRMKTWASILALALSLLLAAIAVGQAPPPGGFNGLEEATDLGVCPDYIQPGQVAVTQSVEFTDSDTDAYDITIKTVTVDNLGTAEDSDVTLIEILDETGAVIGSQSNPEFPVIIVVDDVTITDTGSTVASTTLHVRVTVALTATGDHTIRTRLTAHHTESQWLTGTPFAITADDICASTIVTNASPVADAGADQTVDEGDTVTLDGSGSSDADPADTLTYEWTQSFGPTVTLSDATAVSPTFTAPQVDVDTDLTFELTVDDGNGGTDTDTVNVTVIDTNTAPVADAGADQTVDEGDTVTLDGSGSSDADPGDTLTYDWSQTAGPTVALSDTAAVSPTFTAPQVDVDTDLTFELTVEDGNGGTDTDTVDVTVQDVPCIAPPTSPSNLQANATSQTQINLSWSDNSDNELGFNIYRSITAPASFKTVDPHATVGPDQESYSDTELDCGTLYHYWVTAYNSCGESDPTAVVSEATQACGVESCWENGNITIAAEGSGLDDMGTFGVNPSATDCFESSYDVGHPPFSMSPMTALWFVLQPSCVDTEKYTHDVKSPIPCGQAKSWTMKVQDDGDVNQVTITWDRFSVSFGNCLVSITLTDQVTGAEIDMLDQTTYTYTKVGNPETRGFTIQVSCGSGPVCATADAGADQDVHVGTTAQLDGSGSQNTTTYNWEFVSVPDGSTASLSDDDIVNPTFIADLCGDYVARLWVSNNGCWDSDTVTISAGNRPPVANAGADQTIQAADDNDDDVPDQAVTVQLAGTGADPDGDAITSWHWQWVSFPGATAPALSNNQVANPTFNATRYGNYVLKLQVDDGKPCNTWSAWDQVTITVQEKPKFIFLDDMEHGVNGWDATGQWNLQNNPSCCGQGLPSPTHAWCFGENGRFFRGGLLTSPAIDVTGLTSVDLSFWYCFQLLSTRYRANIYAEVSFGHGWQEVWPGANATGDWRQVGVTVDVPDGATTMRVRFLFQSNSGLGCYCLDDVMVVPGQPIAQYTIGVSAQPPAGGTVSGGGTYNQGASVTVSAKANPGYAFVNWTEGGTKVSTSATYKFAATANRTLVAHFIQVPTHELVVNSTAGGSVTKPAEGTHTYNEGTVVNLKATPDAGYRFVNWTGNVGTVANVNSAATTITMNGDYSITANFEEVTELFFDDMEHGADGWEATGQWSLQNNPSCCGQGLPSPTHAWCFGENGRFFRGGLLTSPAIDVTGLTSVDLSFWYCFQLLSTRYRANIYAEVSFGHGWQEVWPGANATGDWRQVGVTVDVPDGATTMRVRFLFQSNSGLGCYCLDDVMVTPGGAPEPLAFTSDEDLPDFRIDSVQNTPNPIRDVHTTRFEVKGVGIDQIMVQIYDQSGRVVFDSGWQPNGYDWHLDTNDGEILANGIYLYVVTVRGYNGQTVITEVNKLAVYR